jgi:type VI secretion system protein ImpC
MSDDATFLQLLRAPAAPTQPGDVAEPDVATLLSQVPEQYWPALAKLAEARQGQAQLGGPTVGGLIETLRAEIDATLSRQINLILHHPEFQALEATWRGVQFLVRSVTTDDTLKIRVFDISQRELTRTLRKFRGTAWDQSPIFKKIYEEEYGQFGGEPFGVLIGDYYFDHQPQSVQLLGDIAAVAAAAHVPFIAGAAPSLMQMDTWTELANPRDLGRIFQTPEYAPWRSLRSAEDSRYLGLCLPRMLARLPYGALTDPVEDFAFEEDVEANDVSRYAWTNAAFAMGANVAHSFALYGWCSRIHGIETGGIVEDLPVLRFATADGAVDARSCTEIALSERREVELARLGLMSLVHRKNTELAAFISAYSLHKPEEYDDPAASANAVMASRLPYLFGCCRFAHYLKCLVRDKIGGSMSREQLQVWLTDWLHLYVDHSPSTSSEDWKATHPLEEAEVTLAEKEEGAGQYEARFFLKPHYQLEGLTVALRLVSRLPAEHA